MPVFEVQTQDGRAFEVEAPDYDTALQAVDGPISWQDVGAGYTQNFGSNAVKVGQDTIAAIKDLPGTLKGMADLGVGAAQHGYRYLTDDNSAPTPQMDVASGFVEGLKEDYGDTERFMRSLRDKPVETTLDLLLPLSLMRSPIAISKGERLARHKHTTVAHNEAKATKLYDKAEKSGARWSPQEYNSLLGKLGAIPARFKGSVGLTPKSVSLLQAMAKGRNAQNNIDFMMSYRRLAQAKQKEALRAGNDVDATIAKEIKKTIDAEIEKKSPEYIEANKHWARAEERKRIENMINAGEQNSVGPTALGADYTISNEFRKVTRPTMEEGAYKLRSFSPHAQQAITETADRGLLRKALLRIGRAAPTGPVPQGVGLGAFMAGEKVMPGLGAALSGAYWGTGALARAYGNKATRSAAHKAAASAGSGGKLPVDVNLENKARIAAALQQIEENKKRMNRGQY